jgi:fibronectin type III domain protein
MEGTSMPRRIGVALGAVAASLALAASAQAATTPVMHPLPVTTCASSVVASWTPSIADPGGAIVSYRVDIGDLTAGTSGYRYTSGLSTTIAGLINGHQYVVRVRALQVKNNQLTYSMSSGRTFKRLCIYRIGDDILNRYVAYNPFPECIMCGLRATDVYDGVDPVVIRQISVATLPAADGLQAINLEADGSVRFIGG